MAQDQAFLNPEEILQQIKRIARERDQYITNANAEIMGRIGFFNGKLDLLVGFLPEELRSQAATDVGMELNQPSREAGVPPDDPDDSPIQS